jgi:hypothetical protein
LYKKEKNIIPARHKTPQVRFLGDFIALFSEKTLPDAIFLDFGIILER